MVVIEEEIREIKKEIIETRNLIIKTDNLVKNLSADIKAVQKKQDGYQRKYLLNSVAAYVIFVALIGAGAYFFVRSRVEKLKAENQELLSKDSSQKAKIVDLENRLRSKDRASGQALRIYRQLKAGTSEEAIAQFDQLLLRGLTKLERELLGDLVAKKRKDAARIQFEAGQRAEKRKNLEAAEKAFRKAESYLGKTKDPMLTDLYYELGVILHRAKKYAESTDYLQRMLRRSTDKNRNGEAMYLTGMNYEKTAQLTKAKETYLKYLQDYPRHRWSRLARYRLRKLRH